MARPFTVMVTRPEEDSGPLAEALTAAGLSVHREPLLTIAFRDGPTLDPAGVQALAITSANGARALARRLTRRDLPTYCVGPVTARAARELGFSRIETAAGDVAALARLMAGQLRPEAGAIMHAVGAVQAGDLAGALAARGFVCRREILYEALAAERLSPAGQGLLRQDALDGVVVYSARTAGIFLKLAAAAGLDGHLGRLSAFALSAAVAERLEPERWRQVLVAPSATGAGIQALILGASGGMMAVKADFVSPSEDKP